MTELKSCQHCGGTAFLYNTDARGLHISDHEQRMFGVILDHYKVQCLKCGIRTKVYATRKGAFKAWNRRIDNDTERTIG